jgi:uncharacterized protein (DUF302 family)
MSETRFRAHHLRDTIVCVSRTQKAVTVQRENSGARDRDTSELALSVSGYAFGETIERLKGAIAANGNTLFAQIDQSEAAERAGLRLRPTTLLIFGNPKAGTALMDAFPLAALDLPLKCLVWENDGAVSVAYVPMRVIAARHGLTGKDALVGAIDQALKALVDAIAQTQ